MTSSRPSRPRGHSHLKLPHVLPITGAWMAQLLRPGPLGLAPARSGLVDGGARRRRGFRRAHRVGARPRPRRLLQPLALQRADPARRLSPACAAHGRGPSGARGSRYIGVGSWAIAELLFDFAYELAAVSVGRRRLLPRVLPRLLRRAAPARPVAAVGVRPRMSGSTARWRRSLQLRSAPRCCSRSSRQHGRKPGRDRHQPRLPARRHPAALGGDRRLRRCPAEGRPHLGADRRRVAATPSPTGSSCSRPRTTATPRARSSTRCGPPRCCCSAPPRGSPAPVGRRARGPAAARDAGRVRGDRRSGSSRYDHFRTLNVLAASFAGATIVAVIVRTGMTFRENTRILGLMRATRSRMLSRGSATAAGSSPTSIARSRTDRRRAAAARDLRPRRLQALQRHVRPSGGRRPARTARR